MKKPREIVFKAQYEGGMDAINKFIVTHLKYPQEAIKKEIQGTVTIIYRVGSNGKVLDSKIEHGIGYGCDEEAQRLVSLLRYKAQKNKKIRVYHNLSLNINFKLPKKKEKVKQSQPNVVYNYIEKPNKKNSISYTITL